MPIEGATLVNVAKCKKFLIEHMDKPNVPYKFERMQPGLFEGLDKVVEQELLRRYDLAEKKGKTLVFPPKAKF